MDRLSATKQRSLALSEVATSHAMPKLTSLNVSFNEIPPEAGAAIATIIYFSTTLKALNLGDNSLGNFGCVKVTEALNHNRSTERNL